MTARAIIAALLAALLSGAAHAQILFGGNGQYGAQQNGTAIAGGNWGTLNLAAPLSATLGGSTLTVALGGLDANDIAYAAATNSAATITGTWTFTTGSITYGAGSGSKYITFDAEAGTDPTFGVHSSLSGMLYSNVNLAISGSSGAVGLKLYQGTTLLGTFAIATGANTTAYFQGYSTTAANLSTVTATNNTYTNLKVATTAVTCPTSGTTCTATNAIPAGCLLVGVSSRVTTAGNGSCASYDIGTTATANLFSNDTATTAGTTTNNANFNAGTALAPMLYPSATSITATCNGGTFSSTAAAFRFGVHCIDVTAPAS